MAFVNLLQPLKISNFPYKPTPSSFRLSLPIFPLRELLPTNEKLFSAFSFRNKTKEKKYRQTFDFVFKKHIYSLIFLVCNILLIQPTSNRVLYNFAWRHRLCKDKTVVTCKFDKSKKVLHCIRLVQSTVRNSYLSKVSMKSFRKLES